jgi:ATP-binding cassette subfamily D (ALD) protein 4
MEQFQTASSTSPIDDYMSDPLLERQALHPSAPSPQEATRSFDRLFLKRLGRLLRLLFKGTDSSILRTSILIPYSIFLLLSCAVEVIVWFVGLIPSRFYSVLVSLDVEGYWKVLIQSLGLVLLVAVVCVSIEFPAMYYTIVSKHN